MTASFSFEIAARDPASHARLGRLTTPHGTIETPGFIFCGTKAALKAQTTADAEAAGAEIILANTYHLMIQPGAALIGRLGGLHRFMAWDGPMLTDSGGFQIFSMGHGSVADEIKGRRGGGREPSLLKITEEGASFRSYLDGRVLHLGPEESIRIQRDLGADLIVMFDECTPYHVDRSYTAKSMAMTHRWGDRSLAEFGRSAGAGPEPCGVDERQALYGIVQGGVHEDLRIEAAGYTRDRPFFGTAIGGSLGGSKEEMRAVVDWTMPHVHPDRPVHLLGIGAVDDIFAGVRAGIDTFDCVVPTRMGRHGWALVQAAAGHRINLRNARFREDPGPLDPACSCSVCRTYSRAYLHHLIKAGETLALQLMTHHNIATMARLMREIRGAIAAGRLEDLHDRWLHPVEPGDMAVA